MVEDAANHKIWEYIFYKNFHCQPNSFAKHHSLIQVIRWIELS